MIDLNQVFNNGKELLKFLIPPLFTFLAGYFGLRYGIKLFKIQKKSDFKEKQLNFLYGPMYAIHKEIESIGLTRFKVSKITDKIFEEKKEKLSEEEFSKANDSIDGEINYNNKKLDDRILPLFNRMLSIFRDNMYLADEETRKFFIILFEFVEIWDRWKNKGIMSEAIKRIGHNEKNLKPFYDHLENKIHELREEIL